MKTAIVTLRITYDPETGGAVGPTGWDWQDILDLSSQESVEVCTSDDPTEHQGDTCPIHEDDISSATEEVMQQQ